MGISMAIHRRTPNGQASATQSLLYFSTHTRTGARGLAPSPAARRARRRRRRRLAGRSGWGLPDWGLGEVARVRTLEVLGLWLEYVTGGLCRHGPNCRSIGRGRD
jgi:predicted pyridoxine 5'-phosphate oxidase superfamily flavin-nucleotide-binding protein